MRGATFRDRCRRLITGIWFDPRIRFIFFGGISSGVYLVVQVALIEGKILDPVAAAAVGFAVGTLVSYGLNTAFTFGGRFGFITLAKFLLSTSFGYAAGMGAVVLGVWAELHYLVGAGAGLVVAPVVNFMMHKHFTYRL